MMAGLRVASFCALLVFPCFGQTQDLAARAERAGAAMAAGRFVEAAALYRALSRDLPGDAGLKKNLALALYSAGQYREAIANFDAVLKRQQGDPSISFLLGMSNLKIGKRDLAVAALRDAVVAEPGNAMFRFELADALNATGQPDEAIPHFLKLTQLKAAVPDFWYGLGTAYTLSSRRRFSEIERTAPDSGYWYALLGRSRAEQGEFGSAFYFYKRALERLPDLYGAHAALAAIYRQSRHEDWAATEAQRDASTPPPDCASHPVECQFVSGRLENVIESAKNGATPETQYWSAVACSELATRAFSRVLDLPPSAASHKLRAELSQLRNQHAEAAAEWREALKLSPGNPVLELELVKSLRANRDYKEAERVLTGAVARQPDSAELNYLMGDTLLALQDAKRAIPWIGKAARLDPNNMQVRLDLGKAWLQMGDPAKAIVNLEAAAPADREGDVYYLLSQALARVGREDASRRALEKRQALVTAAQAKAAERERDYAIAAP